MTIPIHQITAKLKDLFGASLNTYQPQNHLSEKESKPPLLKKLARSAQLLADVIYVRWDSEEGDKSSPTTLLQRYRYTHDSSLANKDSLLLVAEHLLGKKKLPQFELLMNQLEARYDFLCEENSKLDEKEGYSPAIAGNKHGYIAKIEEIRNRRAAERE